MKPYKGLSALVLSVVATSSEAESRLEYRIPVPGIKRLAQTPVLPAPTQPSSQTPTPTEQGSPAPGGSLTPPTTTPDSQAPAPLPQVVDITSSLTISRTGYRGLEVKTGSVSLTNNTSQPLAGPINYAFVGLTNNVTVQNATGVYSGAFYLAYNINIAPGETVVIDVAFVVPAKTTISYTSAVYSGQL